METRTLLRGRTSRNFQSRKSNPPFFNFTFVTIANRTRRTNCKMRGLISILFLSLFTSSVLSWGSKAKDGKAGECPYMQRKYAQEATTHAGTSCPLKDKCPLYAAVVHGESDIALDSLPNINWSEAAQSMSFQIAWLMIECPLAHVCPYLRDSPDAEIDKLPKDHIEKLLQKCPRLANSPQAKHHVAAAIMGDEHVVKKEKCPYLARPDDDASMHVWEDFYKKSAECPWIQEHGIGELAKSPKAWEAALEV